MSTGMILLTVVGALFLAIVALPVIGGGIIGSAVLMRDVLRKIKATRKIAARMENKYPQKTYPVMVKWKRHRVTIRQVETDCL